MIDDVVKKVEEDIKIRFDIEEKIEYENSKKVLDVFRKNNVSEAHLQGTTGYGYGDLGRDTLEKMFAEIFKAEDALVRSQFISGTHTISCALFGLLRPGDIVLSINGKPYDTLDETLGIRENPSSLKAFNVKYEQIELINNKFNVPEIVDRVSKNDIKLIMIQRSRGYAYRNAFLISEIEEVIKKIREVNKDVIIFVDNCYGEFTETREPIEVGADVTVGSLIKNIGGAIAQTGGYIVGKKDLIELISDRYSAPGLGKEGGASFEHNRRIMQGLFMAPHIVCEAKKIGIFASKLLSEYGFETEPKFDATRSDIVQMIKFNDADKLIKFCQGIQAYSPIDSHVVPMPWDMPGYDSQIIMAAGAFTSGSSIELSCDGPLREPFVGYLQGGITYNYGKIAVVEALKNIIGSD